MTQRQEARLGASLLIAVQRATHLAARHLERELAGVQLGQAEAHILAHLSGAGMGTIAQLHRGFGHRRSTLTSILDRLEKRGLLTRATDRADRRSVQVTLTSKGRRAAGRVAHAVRQLEARVLSQVSAKAASGFWQTISALERSLQ